MRPWMKILPKGVRHLIICRWQYGWHTYCGGHGPDLKTRFGPDVPPDGWEGIAPRPAPWRPLKRITHRHTCSVCRS